MEYAVALDRKASEEERMIIARLGMTLSLVVTLAASGATAQERTAAVCRLPVAAPTQPPDAAACANEQLAGFEGLLILAPHPHDEVLAFAGLIDTYRRRGKPVEIVVVTNGDAYCEACSFWKNASLEGSLCGASDLSNFATPQLDSFAEIRRKESASALTILGAPMPTFLGYPDTGLSAAWANIEGGKPGEKLRRSDFSSCATCGACSTGYAAGPETVLTAAALLEDLSQRIATRPDRTLVATTHWMDGHADHAALGQIVRRVNAEQSAPRPLAFAVVHAHTPKGTSHSDCWHPGPPAPLCECATDECTRQSASWVSDSRAHRLHPTWPAMPPDDADYGAPQSLCLAEDLYAGDHPKKLRAVEAYRSQLGFLARTGSLPERLAGVLDCSGYLISFVRRTEILYLVDPASPGGR